MEQNGYMMSVASLFFELGGRESLVRFMKIGEIDSEFRCPIPLMHYSTKVFVYLKELGFKKEVYEEFLKKLSVCIEERLTPTNLTDSEIEDVQLYDLKMLVVILGRFKDIVLDRADNNIDEFFEFEIARRFLMSPYFEKRINGMKEFKLLAEKIITRKQEIQSEGSR